MTSRTTSPVEALKKYRNSTGKPFCAALDDPFELKAAVEWLEGENFAILRVSDFCGDDTFPDYDALCDALRALNKDAFLLGLGEAFFLRGNDEIFGKIVDLPVATRVVVFGRLLQEPARRLKDIDPKFDSRRVYISSNMSTYGATEIGVVDSNVVSVVEKDGGKPFDGFKRLLAALEDATLNNEKFDVGEPKRFLVSSTLPLKGAIRVSAYELAKRRSGAPLPDESRLDAASWRDFLLQPQLDGFEFADWRTYLKFCIESAKSETSSPYVAFLLDKCCNYEIYKERWFDALLDVWPSDPNFQALYDDRKRLLKGVENEKALVKYVAATKSKGVDRLNYLTDSTKLEKQAIVETLVELGEIPEKLADVYPDLWAYWQESRLPEPRGEELTRHFQAYKTNKLLNRVPQEFKELVDELARDGARPSSDIPTLGSVVEKFDDGETDLFWIDALGVEYVSYIKRRAKELGMRASVRVARSETPTITSLNRGFYDGWRGSKEHPIKALDDLKHRNLRDDYVDYRLPIYLSEELKIIDQALQQIALKLPEFKRVVLASDHGASRLVVLCETGREWENALPGESSRRCCPITETDIKSEFAIQDNDYWTLANYDYFKGGRKASVEAHGGATLEEILVPVIVFANAEKIIVRTTTPKIEFNPLNDEPIWLVVNVSQIVDAFNARFEGKPCETEALDPNTYRVRLPNGLKQGVYRVFVFDGVDELGAVEFEATKKGIKKRKTDDWFF